MLKFIKLPKDLYRVIKCLYIAIQAFSAGCGDGSFLFKVLGESEDWLFFELNSVFALCQPIY